jgi:DNA repair exonuclease SbcCD ATPase subunit
MTLDKTAITLARARLLSNVGWEKMSAYERTIVCCRELTRCGYSIPGWNVLRDIIEKGSGTDISRGKAAYQAELADQMTQVEADSKTVNLDVPDNISDLFENVWRTAVKEAGLVFAIRTAEVNEQLELNRQQMEHERANAQQAIAQTKQLNLDIHTLKQQLQEALRQVDRLQAEKDQTEKLLSDVHDAVRVQTERADAIHAKSQSELKEALTRLEGVESHCLREVERARGEANALVEEAAAASARVVETLKARLEVLKEKNSQLNHAASEGRISAEFYRARYQELESAQNARQTDGEENNVRTKLRSIRGTRDKRKQPLPRPSQTAISNGSRKKKT